MKHTISQKRFLQAAQLFHWATQEQYTLWFTGSIQRSKRTEVILPRLVEKGSLVSVKFHKKNAYACPRLVRHPGYYYKVEHGIGCTEGLIRFWWSNMQAEIIEERFFFGCGSIPEWGLRYSNSMILYEYCTADNFNRTQLIKSKLTAYRNNLDTINRRFNRQGIIVFVCDVPRAKVMKFVSENNTEDLPVFFTDYATFQVVPIGQQLNAKIYIYGGNSSINSLVSHA